ncbi:MAG: molybdopterin-binding protein [Chitinophagaceae bacterium]
MLITGGLSPTSDDITKPLLCKYFNGKMIVNEAALENVKYLFEKVFKRPATEVNLKQAGSTRRLHGNTKQKRFCTGNVV